MSFLDMGLTVAAGKLPPAGLSRSLDRSLTPNMMWSTAASGGPCNPVTLERRPKPGVDTFRRIPECTEIFQCRSRYQNWNKSFFHVVTHIQAADRSGFGGSGSTILCCNVDLDPRFNPESLHGPRSAIRSFYRPAKKQWVLRGWGTGLPTFRQSNVIQIQLNIKQEPY